MCDIHSLRGLCSRDLPLFVVFFFICRLEVEPSGLLDGRSLWWSRRIRRGLLVEAVDGAALAEAGGQAKSARQGASGGGDERRMLSSAVGEWIEGTASGGPF